MSPVSVDNSLPFEDSGSVFGDPMGLVVSD